MLEELTTETLDEDKLEIGTLSEVEADVCVLDAEEVCVVVVDCNVELETCELREVEDDTRLLDETSPLQFP